MIHQPHHGRARCLERVLASVLTLANISPAFAQTVAPTPVSAKNDTLGEQVVMSPFEVVAEEDGSYQATRTLAGTRFNTELKNVPASLSVMTADFLQDIGALNVTEAIEYTMNAEPDMEDTTGNNRQSNDLNLRMRGFRNATLSRNYFQSGNAADNYNTERITINRGPNAVIFGTGGAGGIVDTTTKRAGQRAITTFTNRIAPYDDYRFEFDVNRPLTKALSARVNLLYQTRQAWRDVEYMKRRSGALAMTWKLFAKTTLRLDSEFGQVDQVKAQPWPAFDAVTPWLNAGRPISPTFGAVIPGTGMQTTAQRSYIENSGEALMLQRARVGTNAPAPSGGAANGITMLMNESIVPFRNYLGGPGMSTNNDFGNVGLFLEQQMLTGLFFEAAANTQRRHLRYNQHLVWNHITLNIDPNAQRPDGSPNPYVGQYYIENGSREPRRSLRNERDDDYRASVSYSFELGRLGSHQVAAMVAQRDSFNRNTTRAEAWINNPGRAVYTNADNLIHHRTYVSFFGPNPLKLPPYQLALDDAGIDSNGVRSGWFDFARTNNRSELNSRVAVAQSRWFKDRLVTTFGLRRDALTNWGSTESRDAVTNAVTGVVRNGNVASRDGGTTRTMGAVLHLRPWLALAANSSNNATPQTGVVLQVDGLAKNQALGNRAGEGIDLALRFNLFDRRLQGSIAYYETSENNAATSYPGSWRTWLQDAYLILGKLPRGAFTIDGADTVDIVGHGWETEWIANVNQNLKFVATGNITTNVGSNQFPRISALAVPVLKELRALAPDTPIPGGSTGTGNTFNTAGLVADQIEAQLANNVRTEGLAINNSRKLGSNIYANYQFTQGRLKGFGFGLGLNVKGRLLTGYDTVTNAPIFGKGTTYVNAQFMYRRNLKLGSKRVGWDMRLGGTNILGHRGAYYPTSADQNGFYRIAFETVPVYSLTNKFSF
jgi:iron complex outermembrane receptor protein